MRASVQMQQRFFIRGALARPAYCSRESRLGLQETAARHASCLKLSGRTQGRRKDGNINCGVRWRQHGNDRSGRAAAGNTGQGRGAGRALLTGRQKNGGGGFFPDWARGRGGASYRAMKEARWEARGRRIDLKGWAWTSASCGTDAVEQGNQRSGSAAGNERRGGPGARAGPQSQRAGVGQLA